MARPTLLLTAIMGLLLSFHQFILPSQQVGDLLVNFALSFVQLLFPLFQQSDLAC